MSVATVVFTVYVEIRLLSKTIPWGNHVLPQTKGRGNAELAEGIYSLTQSLKPRQELMPAYSVYSGVAGKLIGERWTLPTWNRVDYRT